MSCGDWRGQATRPRDEKRIRVYFMVYEDSVEEQRYLTTLKYAPTFIPSPCMCDQSIDIKCLMAYMWLAVAGVRRRPSRS